ncbi:MAG: TonB-dependent receptor [Ignavibacteria bacterium]|nr:TonB-dependent receptor [Ignavibacteria bacterium]
MKFLYALLACALLMPAAISNAHPIRGVIYGDADGKKEPLSDAVVKWINTTIGTATDEKGNFEIPDDGITDFRLIAMYSGYKTDTIEAKDMDFVEIVMKPSASTEVIKVEDRQSSTYFEPVTAKTEAITAQELVKDACCDLSGCFGRNSSVEVAVTDILTDSKELKILGLEGVYTQILTDNMPLLTGLNVKYGVSSIPGTLIDKITVSKGSNSVIQGYESISGIMNVLIRDYDNSDRILANAFINSMLEKQVNLNLTSYTGKKWSTIGSFHSAQKSNRIDDNGDGFLDNPLTTRYVLYNKWKFENKKQGTDMSISGRYWNEERIGGQDNFNIESDEGSNIIYGQTAKINSGEASARYSAKLGDEKSMKLYASGSYYDQNSFYGFTSYDAVQGFANLTGFYEFKIADMNFLKAGASYRYQNIEEVIAFEDTTNKTYNGVYDKLESIPGIFAENSLNFLDSKATLNTGLRYDYHNKYGSVVTPRALVRYQPDDAIVLRASIGTGFRTANVFSENSNILASSRNVIFLEELDPERILNFGGDVLIYFNAGDVGGNLNLDYYHTTFFNKIIPDYDTDPSVVYFSNLDGSAHSNVFQAEANLNMFRNFDLKLAYKFIDSEYDLNGVTYEQPFISKDRVFVTFSYAPQSNSFSINGGLQWYGRQRLPSTAGNPEQYTRPEESDPYTMINAQINKNFKYFELYAGVENLLDFTQPDPIIAPEDPFGPYFDTSYIWGPTKGREFYFGFRFLFD